jgi:hypothetical protein
MNNPHPSSMARRSFGTISIARMRVTAGLAAIVGLGVAAVTMASCTVDDGARPISNMNGAGGGGSGSSGSSSSGDPLGPCVDGTKAECHETVGTNGDILTCLNGERTCVGGVWGPCAGEFSSKSMPPSDDTESAWAPGEYRPLGLTDAGPCQNNPCDPYCQDFEEVPPVDGGYEVIPTVETVFYTGSLADALALTPPGFVSKGLKEPCSTTIDCQFDSHCLPTGTNGVTCPNGVAKCCMPWGSGEFNASCAKPDATTGFACTQTINGVKVPTIPVCNRGSVTLPAPTRIYVFPGNSPQYPLCIPDKDPYICDTTAPVAPGKCINVLNCPGLTGNGTKAIMINGPTNGGGGQAPNNPVWRDECTCENNWGVWSGNSTPCYEKPIYAASTVIKYQVYQAICPSGTQPQWGYLAWNTTTPLDSNVLWDARVATTNAGLSAATFINLGNAKATPAPNTQVCAMGGPAPCPINLYTAFGGTPIANSEFLELKMTINPSTDKTQGATVNNWQITYSCPPAQ